MEAGKRLPYRFTEALIERQRQLTRSILAKRKEGGETSEETTADHS